MFNPEKYENLITEIIWYFTATGKMCTVLSNYHFGSGSYSGLDFHMYNKECTESAFFICENGKFLERPVAKLINLICELMALRRKN